MSSNLNHLNLNDFQSTIVSKLQTKTAIVMQEKIGPIASELRSMYQIW